MERRYGLSLRAIFALFWLSTAAFIAVVVVLNVAGINVDAHNSAHIVSSGQTNGGGENINLDSLAVLSVSICLIGYGFMKNSYFPRTFH